jgi:hypothetical protein
MQVYKGYQYKKTKDLFILSLLHLQEHNSSTEEAENVDHLLEDTGMWEYSWLRHCARKVTAYILDEVSEFFFSLSNPSSCTMALELTQPLTGMSTIKPFRRVKCGWCVRLWDPHRPRQPVTCIASFYYISSFPDRYCQLVYCCDIQHCLSRVYSIAECFTNKATEVSGMK